MAIRISETEQDIRRCFSVMKQLRTDLTEDEFVTRVQRQIAGFGYTLVCVEEGGDVKSVAGFRISECLYAGKNMYVDDFVTDAEQRSKGYGEQLFDWMVEYAKANGCEEFGLDSGVQRYDAHRFYLNKRMNILCHHFSLKLGTQ